MNKNELLVGLILTLCLTPIMGALGLLALIICPLLWALSGMQGQDKIWRRLGVPVVWALAIFAHCHHWLVFLAIPCSFGALCIGYGIPSTQPPDDGSWLGRLFYKLCGGDAWWANFCTRLTIYTLALLPMFILGR